MRRAIVLITSLALLAAPALAQAKTGVIFQKDPETAKVGEKIHFTVVVFREPRNPQGQAGPLSGRRPLVTSTSASGRVIRVRASRTDLNGTGSGDIAFTDKGPWKTTVAVSGVHMVGEQPEAIGVGTGLVQVTPPATAAHAPRTTAAADTAGFPWLWILSFAAIGSALLVFVMRRRGHWGAT